MNLDNSAPEQIAQHYSAAMDSVNLINDIKAGKYNEIIKPQEKADVLERNAAHLEIMLEKSFWTNENLQPLRDAVSSARS